MAKKGPAPGQAYGIASISNALQGAEFPMSKNDVIEKYGGKEIQWRKGQPSQLKEILESTPDQQYKSMADLVSAVSKSERK